MDIQKRQHLVDKRLIEAAIYGNVAQAKYWLTSAEVKKEYGVNADIHCISHRDRGYRYRSAPLLYACINGYPHMVKYLLASPELQEHANVNDALVFACRHGHFQLIRYILTNPQLKDLGQMADIPHHNNEILMAATAHGSREILDYLFQSPEIEQHIKLSAGSAINDSLMVQACSKGNVALLRYFLEGKETAQAFSQDSKVMGLRLACEANHVQIMNYFLLEQVLDAKAVEPLAEKYPRLVLLMEKRHLHESLSEHLPTIDHDEHPVKNYPKKI